MSQDQPMQNGSMAARPAIRVRFDQLKRSPGLNIIGIPELIALSGAALIALITVFAYFYFLLPAQSRLKSAQVDRDRLQALLRSEQFNYGKESDAQTTVDKIKASLEDFEGNWLAAPATGRMTLYKELNNLIRSSGLHNTAGPSYTPLQPSGTKNAVQPTATASQQSNAKWQTVYPGIAVSVTVEGPYQNIRRFIRDIETSREFLIINAVELESVTHTGGLVEDVVAPARTIAPTPRTPAPVTAEAAQPAGDKGGLVSLRLDIATYFRRPGSEGDTTP
jgi:Tfp pilus assembly protein PilO